MILGTLAHRIPGSLPHLRSETSISLEVSSRTLPTQKYLKLKSSYMQWTQILAHLTSHGWRWATENRLDGRFLDVELVCCLCALPTANCKGKKSHEIIHIPSSSFDVRKNNASKVGSGLSLGFIWEVMLAISCHIAADGFKRLNDHSHLMKDVAINRVPLLS